MGNQRVKTSEKNEEATVPWADLPQEILGFIIGKFVYAADVIRFRAVCKNWYIPKDMIIKYKDDGHLPWLCNFSWAENNNSDRLECEVYDPYSRLIFPTLILVGNPTLTKRDNYDNKVFGYGSKQGWLIAAYYDNDIEKWCIFLYNPYTKGVFSFPDRFKCVHKPCFATFSGNPFSRDFQIFVFYCQDYNYKYMARYTLSEDMVNVIGMTMVLVDWGPAECRGMQYMNEHLFCLFDNGFMKRFSLKDTSWISLDLGEGSRKLVNDQLWLAKGDGDLLVAVKTDFEGNCSTFCFDWSNTSWVERDLPESSAILISGDITTFVRPFVGNKGCNVYFFSELICEKEASDYNLLQI